MSHLVGLANRHTGLCRAVKHSDLVQESKIFRSCSTFQRKLGVFLRDRELSFTSCFDKCFKLKATVSKYAGQQLEAKTCIVLK